MANMATESIYLKASCVNGKYVGLMCLHVLLVLLLSSIVTSSKFKDDLGHFTRLSWNTYIQTGNWWGKLMI
uniref:Uncharacterized protein n=1 Tax=Quercus lobata TaxID=97700 RepID=A0A7N2LM60_QUELO